MSKPKPCLLLYPRQTEFRDSDALFRGFTGGIGSGKSFILAYDLIRRALPKRTYLCAAPTYPMLRDATLRSFFDVAQRLDLSIGFHKTDYIASLPHGAEILFRSTDDPERLRGPNLTGVALDEASLMDRAVFDVTIGRLRQAGEMGWLSAAFTPKGKAHWTYEVFACGGSDVSLVRARTLDNPFLPKAFYEKIKSQYTSALAAQELEGEFTDVAGALFRRHWFPLVDAAPADLRLVRAWDLASTDAKKAEDPDYTVGVLMGKSAENVYYVLDVRRVRASPGEVERLIKRTAEEDGRAVSIGMEQEPGAAGVTVVDHYLRNVLAGWSFRGEKSTGPKEVRAQPLAAQAEAGNVRLVRATWNKDFLDEYEIFPMGGHDDQVDAGSLAFTKLALGPWRRLNVFV